MEQLPVHNSAEVVAAKKATVYEALLRLSPRLGSGNFAAIGDGDLALLFGLYDREFFDGWLASAVAKQAEKPLALRVSATMTRSGGKTTRFRRRGRDGQFRDRYEIAIAGRLLLLTFGDVDRPVVVCGLTCRDRLDALQRIMEHEIIHLAELLVWGSTSCSTRRFKNIAGRIFGHADTKHDLVTPHERASVQHGVSVGSQVEFDFNGRQMVGRVNRISQRATVLVPAEAGRRYTDGGTYDKYYIPVPMLRPVCT